MKQIMEIWLNYIGILLIITICCVKICEYFKLSIKLYTIYCIVKMVEISFPDIFVGKTTWMVWLFLAAGHRTVYSHAGQNCNSAANWQKLVAETREWTLCFYRKRLTALIQLKKSIIKPWHMLRTPGYLYASSSQATTRQN